MKIKKKSLLTMLLVLAMACTMLTGCGGETSTPADSAPASVSGETPAAPEQPAVSMTEETVSAAEVPAVESKLPENYPMIAEDGMTVTAFQATNPNMTDLMEDYNDLAWWQEVTRRTGIGFEWKMTPFASAEEQFNLLCASSALPTLVCTANYYSEGIASAVENDVFVDLAPYLEICPGL